MPLSSTIKTSSADLELALEAVRGCVAAQDYAAAHLRLGDCARIAGEVLPSMTAEERRHTLAGILATLEWAHIAVKAGREHARRELSNLKDAKVYRMPDPAARSSWKVEG